MMKTDNLFLVSPRFPKVCYSNVLYLGMHNTQENRGLDLTPKWVRLARDGKNLGLFLIRFLPFGGQFDPLWGANLTSSQATLYPPTYCSLT